MSITPADQIPVRYPKHRQLEGLPEKTIDVTPEPEATGDDIEPEANGHDAEPGSNGHAGSNGHGG